MEIVLLCWWIGGIKENMAAFLQNIRKSNPFGPIVIEVDNAKIHHAKMVTALAEMLDGYVSYERDTKLYHNFFGHLKLNDTLNKLHS